MPCVPPKWVLFITGGYSPIPKIPLFFMFVEPSQVCSLDLHKYLEDPILLLPLPTTHNTLEMDYLYDAPTFS
jgi:hypothetical protein